MTDENGKIKLFDTHQVRAEWDAESEKWWFSIVDIVTILTESVDGTAYWRKLKQRLKAEGNETVTSCHGLKMRAADGNPQGLAESAEVAAEGAQTAKAARLQLEKKHRPAGGQPIECEATGFAATAGEEKVVSQIDELMAELCPEGVEFKELGELLDYEQPGKYLVASIAYDDSYATPVLTAGQTFILGYTDETNGIYPASQRTPVIIFDDFTTAFKWVDFPFKAKSSAMKMLTLKAGALDSLKYAYYAMQTIVYAPQDHARQWIGTYSKFRIPVPPLEVQREVVKVLDTFTQLEAELEAELEARRRQYQYYRDALLTFDDASVASASRQAGKQASKQASRQASKQGG